MPRLVHKATGVVVNVSEETAKQLSDYEPADKGEKTTSRSTKK